MNNQTLLATLAGGVVAFLGGWVIWGMLLMSYSQSQMTEAGAAVMKEMPILWEIAVGNLIFSFLLALIYSRWASISTLKTGAIAGAVISGLISLSNGFMWHAMMDMTTGMTGIFVDTLASAVWGALVGGTIGWVLGYKR